MSQEFGSPAAEQKSGVGKCFIIILALLIGLPLVLVLCAIVVIAILLLLGPVVGNVFSNIVVNLGTPTP